MTLKRILLAEDDVSMRRALTHVLESDGYQVVPANTAVEAAAQFWARPPDLALLDLNAVAQDEWWAVDEICAADPVLPIILIVRGSVERRERAMRLGADALFEQPFDFPILLDTIARFMAQPGGARVARMSRKPSALLMLCKVPGPF